MAGKRIARDVEWVYTALPGMPFAEHPRWNDAVPARVTLRPVAAQKTGSRVAAQTTQGKGHLRYRISTSLAKLFALAGSRRGGAKPTTAVPFCLPSEVGDFSDIR